MESSSSVINIASDDDFKEDEFADEKSSIFESSENVSKKELSSRYQVMISIEEPCQISSPIISDDESALLDDVKVCDICGDAGREDLLAVCSKCGDGAEHIYCMRTRLDKVPDNYWMCEECVLSEDKDKMTRTKTEEFIIKHTSSKSYRNDDIAKGSDLKVLPQMSKGFVVDKSGRERLSSLLSPDKISRNRISTLMRNRTALGTKSGPSSMSKDNKAHYPQNLASKQNHELSSRTRSIQENVPFPSISGNLTKSKSFNGSDKRPKVLRLDEIPQNQFSNETHNKKKVSTLRAFRKSVSFNDASPGHSNAFSPKFQRIPPKFSEESDLKRLRSMKEHDSNETSKFEFNKPQVGRLGNGSCLSAPPFDKSSAFLGEIKLLDASGTKSHNAKAVRSSREADDAIWSSQSPTGSNTSEELMHKGETNHDFSSAKVPLHSFNANGEDKLPSQKESSNPTQKVAKMSTFSSSSTDSRMEASGSESISRREHNLLADCSSVPIIDGALMKDKSGSSQMDLAKQSYNQLTTLAYPKFDYIWKGEFEIQRGRLPGVLYRIQAHLSTQASPRIPEAVKKFSDKIILEEVSRFNAWPTQFQEQSPQDDSIGLYFFAEDLMSYGNYKSLLHCMADHDLALRGNINGIEVLIFSSNLLPEGSQYWNGFLFLWGVFRYRKVTNCNNSKAAV